MTLGAPPIPPILPPLPLAVKGGVIASPFVIIILLITLLVYLVSLGILLRELLNDWRRPIYPSDRYWVGFLLGCGAITAILALGALVAVVFSLLGGG